MTRTTRSIAIRLTLLVGAIAFVIFSVVVTLVYLALDRELSRRESEELAGRMDFVLHLLTEVKDISTPGALTHHLDDMIASHGNLRVWITTQKNDEVIYGGKLPNGSEIDTRSAFHVAHETGVTMRAVTQQLPPTQTLPGLNVLVAIDTRPVHELLAKVRIVLFGLYVAGVVAMVVLGAWATRRSLRPVSELSRQAQAIGPQTLSRRLPAAILPAELVDLAQSFNRVLDRLEESHHQLEAFNADVAHELRTPLSNLIGGTEVALSRERSAEEFRNVLASNLEELDHMKTMVNDMLFLARADRGEHAATATVVRLEDVAQKVAEFFEALLDEQQVRLEIVGEASVAGDERLLRRAVTNLVANAVRYTEAGQTIRMLISNESDTTILRVCNPGPPIAPEHLAHIFDRFYRADAARHPGGESHGLGLAIVKAIVQMHSGEVVATCANGVTEVGFSLPQAR